MAKTDKTTLELIKKVKEQKAEIAKIERPSYRTNNSFTYVEGNMSNAVNLNVENNVKNLICIIAYLQEKLASYNKAAESLAVESVPEFTWQTFSVADWMADVKLRINKLQIGAKKKKLEALEERLNKIISPELRAELELEAIAKELD